MSLSTSGYHDGLGLRTLIFDREGGVMLERLILRPELGAFEQALRIRARSSLEDERFARVRTVGETRIPLAHGAVGLVAANRLCDLIDAAAIAVRDERSPSVDVGLAHLITILPASTAAHGGRHDPRRRGSGRVLLTPAGDVVVPTPSTAGAERLQFADGSGPSSGSACRQ